MAGKGAVALDKVVINIETGVGNTHKNIDKLAKSLGTLKKSISGGFNNIHKLSQGIQELNKASKNLPNTIKNLKTIEKIVKPLNTLSDVVKPSGLISTINALEKLPKVFKSIDPRSLENVVRVSAELASALSPLSDKLSMIGNGFSALSNLAKTYGVQITRVGTGSSDAAEQIGNVYSSLRLMGRIFRTVGRVNISVIKDFDKAFDKMSSKIKQIGLSLLGTRTIFTATRKAISEYMALDQQLTKETRNLWRALGAQLVPAVEMVLHVFKQIVRVIYSVVYALTGIDLIAKANAKALSAMSSSASDALGNLQKFDDLNVAEFDKGDGDDSLIKLDKIDLSPIQKVIDWMNKLKDAIVNAWKNGGWNDVAKVLSEGINGAADAIDSKAIAAAISRGITGTLDFIQTFIENSDWEKLGTKIGDVFRNIPWSSIWDKVVETAIVAFNGFDDFMDSLFGFEGAGEIGVGLWAVKMAKILSGSDIVKFFIDMVGHSDKLIGKLDILRIKLDDIWAAFEVLGKGVFPELVGQTMHVSTGFAKMLAPLASMATKLGGLFGGSFAAGTAATIGLIVVAVMALIQAFKNLYQNSEPFRNTVNGLIDSIKGTLLGVLDALKNIIMQLWDLLVVVWSEVLKPLFDLLVSIVEPFLAALISILAVLWENTIKPIIDGLVKLLMPAIGFVIDVVKALVVVIGAVIDIIQWLWNYVLEPIVEFLLDIVVGAVKAVGLVFEIVVDSIFAVFQALVDGIVLGWALLKVGFISLYKAIYNGFVKPLKDAWEGIVNTFKSMWDGLKNWCKNGLNGIIDLINKAINKLNDKLSINIGSTVAKVLDAVGVDVKEGKYQLFTIPNIPKLEVGTNEIPYEGIYHLHEGEAVVPKKYNPALGNGTDEELGQKLDTLISIMNNMNFTNVVNIGNETLYKKQQRYNKIQNDKYGTTVNL